MRKSDIFVGNINRCVKRVMISSVEKGKNSFGYSVIESEPYKENAILIRLGKETYADLENIDSHLHYVYLKTNHREEQLQRSQTVLTTTPIDCEALYVDKESLRPYESLKSEKDKISVKRLKIEAKHGIDKTNK